MLSVTIEVDENAKEANVVVNENIESSLEKKELENDEVEEDANTSSVQPNHTGDNVALDDTAEKEVRISA